jgi:TolB-like protein/tetratricopeptide (TPR) repeat protein
MREPADIEGTDHTIRFGPFELDRDQACLRKHGVRLRIQNQSLQVLIALLENAGGIVNRDELIKRVWPSGVFVDFDHGLNAAVNRLRQVLQDSARSPRYIETIARRGYSFIGQILPSPKRPSAAARRQAIETNEFPKSASPCIAKNLPSIAVLPFASLGVASDSENFGDGLADEIVTALTKVRGIRVIARASASLFRSRAIPLQEVAERLGVSLVLDGSLRRHGDRIRVTAQLVEGAGQTCLWSEKYDRKLIDILDVQEDISQSIVHTLKLEVTGQQLLRRYTTSEDAYLFYLRGLFYPHDWTLRGIERVRAYMKRVVAIERGYAPAWVELAHAAVGRVMHGVPPAQAMPEGVDAASRAISADPDLAEAHGVSGYLKGLYEHAWSEALSDIELAIRLNGASPSIRFWHGVILNAIGRVEEGIGELQRSLEADPLSVLANMHLCRQHTVRGDFDTAISYGQRAVQAGPHCFPALARLGEACFYSGEMTRGIELLQSARSMACAEGWYTAALAAAYCHAGRRSEAEDILRELEHKRRNHYVPSSVLAFTAAALGDLDLAFQYFRGAVADRDGILFFVANEPSLNALRNDVRYADLLASINIPPAVRLNASIHATVSHCPPV